METIEVTQEERPLIRKVIERDRASYRRREWPDRVLNDPDLAAEVAIGEIARDSLALQVTDGEGPLMLEGDPGVLSDYVGDLIVALADNLDPIRDGMDRAERRALRIATLAAEVRRLDNANRRRN